MATKTTKTKKRIMPKAITIYFNDDNISFANEIERIAQEYHLSVSTLCSMALQAGMPKVFAGLLHMKLENEKLFTQQRAESIK